MTRKDQAIAVMRAALAVISDTDEHEGWGYIAHEALREADALLATHMAPLESESATQVSHQPESGAHRPQVGFFDEQYGNYTDQHKKDNE